MLEGAEAENGASVHGDGPRSGTLLRIGDRAPDFTAKATPCPDGPDENQDLTLSKYMGGKWGMILSHPADFTPVCQTEVSHSDPATKPLAPVGPSHPEDGGW